MIHAENPINEIERLEALVRYDILDTDPEKEYDDIARIAAHVCNMPVAMVSFIDETRKWYKATFGIASKEMAREIAVCSHTIVYDEEIMVVEDARKDVRFIDSPATQGSTPTIFYAGVKLVDSEGFVLGTICVVDHKPNTINDRQSEILHSLGNQVIKLLEHRRNNILLNKIKQHVKMQYEELEKFTYAVAHDINSPINSIISLAQLLESQPHIDTETRSFASKMIDSGYKLTDYVSSILDYYKSDKLSTHKKEEVSVHSSLKKILALIDPQDSCEFRLLKEDVTIHVRVAALDQILINLIKNAITHCDKKKTFIEVDFNESDSFYTFSIQDNGPGIDLNDQEKIFGFMETLQHRNTSGSGIGLALVKKIVEKEGGTVSVASTPGKGCTFHFTLRK
ncbi:MAG: GAF domain-containing sensor histidine kinase [Ekhidna sp.]